MPAGLEGDVAALPPPALLLVAGDVEEDRVDLVFCMIQPFFLLLFDKNKTYK
jgi:hypothetical protein